MRISDWSSDVCSSDLGGEQADPHVLGLVDRPAVDLHDSVGDAHDQLAHDHPLDLYLIGDLLRRFQDLAAELDLADAERPAAAYTAEPAEEETHALPHGVQPAAAGHHRVAQIGKASGRESGGRHA